MTKMIQVEPFEIKEEIEKRAALPGRGSRNPEKSSQPLAQGLAKAI